MKPVLFLLCLFSLLISSCISMLIDSQSNSSNDFGRYHTFAWINRPKNHKHADPLISNDIIEQEIINYCNRELKARGYVVDTLQPDILLDYDLVTKNKVEIQQQPVYRNRNQNYYANRGNGRNQYNNMNNQFPNTYVSGYKNVKIPYEEGTVTIYIIERASNKLQWQGWAQGAISDPGSFERELPRDIKSIFKKYPVKVVK